MQKAKQNGCLFVHRIGACINQNVSNIFSIVERTQAGQMGPEHVGRDLAKLRPIKYQIDLLFAQNRLNQTNVFGRTTCGAWLVHFELVREIV